MLFRSCARFPSISPRLFVRNFFFSSRMARFNSMQELVNHLKEDGVITSPEVEKVMLQVDRAHYVKRDPYQDCPQSIDMHAYCLEVLKDHLKPGNRVLDVGSGSGILCSAFGLMVGPTGRVIGIDRIPQLIDMATKNIRKEHPQLLDNGIVSIKVGDGWKGDPENAPFDAIHVGASAAALPKALVDQLAPGGRMVIPVGPQSGSQYIYIVDKLADGSIRQQRTLSVRYVPLVQE